MTQAQLLYWLEGKPQIGQDTGGRGAGSYIPVGEGQTGRVGALSGQLFSSRVTVLSPGDRRRGIRVWNEPNLAA